MSRSMYKPPKSTSAASSNPGASCGFLPSDTSTPDIGIQPCSEVLARPN